MSEWPNGWFRGPGSEAGAGSGSGDKTFNLSADQYSAAASQGPVAPGSWPAQPPASSAGGASYGGLASPTYSPAWTGGGGGFGGPRWRGWLRPKRIFTVLAVIVALLLVAAVGTYFYLNSKLHRSNILVNYSGRPAPGSGTNWLIAGSDSRQGLSKKQERRFATGQLDASGFGRSDTILILHIPASGKPLLISIPRDSLVDIPGHGQNKINAAFSFGGPTLLAETVQKNTGLYISHFMDIGFGGFVRVVNSVGGVRMCLVHSLHDHASGLHLHTGCQVLHGGEALAYVRDRHNFTTQDLQREQDQRIFLKALLSKLTSPGVMLNPFASLPAASNAIATLTVDKGTSLYQLFGVAEAMRNPQTTTVPIGGSYSSPSVGDALVWNSAEAKALFNDLNTGQTVPKKLISGSHQGK
ncbi:MAG TPA: LCP family protein [Streptosporangiaceae bacterium]|nr:LCP family protein [Streptosporangiaceae bacterium]